MFKVDHWYHGPVTNDFANTCADLHEHTEVYFDNVEFCQLANQYAGGFLGLFNMGNSTVTETGYHANDLRINADGTYTAHFDHWVGGCDGGMLYEHEHDQGYGAFEYWLAKTAGRVTD